MSRLSISMIFVVILVLALTHSISGGIIRDRRQAVRDYYYSNGVVNNVVSDNMLGGPTSLGWAQVPHRLSPMFSPIFGGKR